MKPPDTSHQNRLGHYRLLRQIGQGGMGVVYLALDDSLDRHVAVKILRLDKTPDPRARALLAKRFLREAKSAARLNHPNVVTIYSVNQAEPAKGQGETVPQPYLVMEYVDGGTLADQLRQAGPLHWREAARVVADALKGLAAAHQKGVVHRDIKPANLMRARGPAGEPIIKLTDFGLARIAAGPQAGDGELTFPGAFVGSPSYSSPEQIAGLAHIDGRADLYSLAAAWYALLTGQPPFVDDDPEEVMQRHLHEPFPPVRALAPDVPEPLEAILAKASAKRKEQRFATALAMFGAVEKLLALPADIPSRAAASRKPRRAATSSAPDVYPPNTPASDTIPAPSSAEAIAQFESRLSEARASHDSSTQIETLRTLYRLYSKFDHPQQAIDAFREALALHIKMHAPQMN